MDRSKANQSVDAIKQGIAMKNLQKLKALNVMQSNNQYEDPSAVIGQSHHTYSTSSINTLVPTAS